jgi:hypothetical protein
MGAEIFADFFIGSPVSEPHAIASLTSQLTPSYRESTSSKFSPDTLVSIPIRDGPNPTAYYIGDAGGSNALIGN